MRRRALVIIGIRAFDLAPKTRDQIAEAGLARRNAGELLGVIEHSREIAGVAIETHEREQRVVIAGMAGETLLENRQAKRLLAPADARECETQRA